ncbi:hypothetical protein M3J09_012682 [Ascochyta lentis]
MSPPTINKPSYPTPVQIPVSRRDLAISALFHFLIDIAQPDPCMLACASSYALSSVALHLELRALQFPGPCACETKSQATHDKSRDVRTSDDELW